MRLPVELLQELAKVPNARADQADVGLRSARRVPLRGRAQAFPVHDQQFGAGARVTLCNISIDGVAFHSDLPLGLGSMFVLCLATSTGQPVRLLASVRRCERVGVGTMSYLVAGTFNRVLANNPANAGELQSA